MTMYQTSNAVHARRVLPSAGRRDVAAVAGLLLLTGLLDHAAGYEVSVLAVYLLPLWYATARLGYRAGLFTVLPATAVWCIADLGHPYSQDWFLYLNGLTRAIFFACGVIAAHHLVGTGVRPDHGPGAAQGTGLPGASVCVCGRCEKIRDHAGGWYTTLEFLREQAGFSVQSRICPDCARRDFARGERRAPGARPDAVRDRPGMPEGS